MFDAASETAHDRSVHSPRHHVNSQALADVLFGVTLAAFALLRWRVMAAYPEPSGLDGGNWLAFGHALLGSHARSSSIVYPPVVPLLSVGFAQLWGPFLGTKFLALAASLVPAAGMYVLLRESVGTRALLMAGLLGPAAATGEAVAWGGYPQLLGLGMLPLTLWGISRFLAGGRLRWAIVASAFLLLALASNELIGTATAAAGLIYVVARVILERPRLRLSTFAAGAAIVALPTLVLAPIYLALLAGLGSELTRTTDQRLTLGSLYSTLNLLFREDPAIWIVASAVAVLAPLTAIAHPHRQHLPAASAAIVTAMTVVALVLHDKRAVYLLPLSVAIGLSAWWALLQDGTSRTSRAVDTTLWIGATLFLVIETYLGIAAFDYQVAYYTALSPGFVTGLQELDRTTPRSAVLAVSPAATPVANQYRWPLGWWVEGVLDRPTIYASDPQWLNFDDELKRASIGNRMFDPAHGETAAIEIARANGIQYIIVATGWSGYVEWSRHAELNGARVVLSNDAMIVISVFG